jgi:hypothetical protein
MGAKTNKLWTKREVETQCSTGASR